MNAREPMQRDLRPVPDPTTLTTEALRRENAALREVIEAKLETVNQRITYESSIGCIKHEFAQKQFSMLAEHKREIAGLSQKALDAALTAADATANGLRETLNDVKTRLDRGEGQKTGGRDAWGYVVGAIGAVVGVVGLAAMFLKH